MRWHTHEVAVAFLTGAALGAIVVTGLVVPGVALAVAWVGWLWAVVRASRRGKVDYRHTHVYVPWSGGVEIGRAVEEACHEAGSVVTYRGNGQVEVRGRPWLG